WLLGGCVAAKPGTDRADAGGGGGQDAIVAGDAVVNADAEPQPDALPGDAVAGMDASEDGGVQTDAEPAETGPRDATVQLPTAIGVSNGSGSLSSANYRAKVKVGGPSPVGRAQSTSYRVHVGTP